MDIIDAMAPEYGESRNAASIKIIGVGGGGGNAANRMYAEGIPDVDFIICNSDEQDLRKSPIPTKIRLGQGLGCGSNAEKGEEYAKEVTAEIEELLTAGFYPVPVARPALMKAVILRHLNIGKNLLFFLRFQIQLVGGNILKVLVAVLVQHL